MTADPRKPRGPVRCSDCRAKMPGRHRRFCPFRIERNQESADTCPGCPGCGTSDCQARLPDRKKGSA